VNTSSAKSGSLPDASHPGGITADKGRRFSWNDKSVVPILFIIPVQLLLLLLLVFPFLLELYISFTEWQPTYGAWWDAEWAWGINFYYLVTDEPRFWEALLRTFAMSAIALGLEFLLGMGLALQFLKRFPGKKVAFTALLTPMMIMPVVVGYTWFMLFQVNGPINQIAGLLLFTDLDIAWLNRPALAFAAVIATEVWHWTPLFFLILYSGLNAVPENPIRAAVVLGATPWQIFWHIVLPAMRPVIIVAFVIRGMEVLKLFDEVYLLTRGGPGTATETISMYLYKLAFQDFRLAYAGAAAFIVLVLTVVLINLMLRPIRYRLLEAKA
jgi:multiple sugar transport system permease protein